MSEGFRPLFQYLQDTLDSEYSAITKKSFEMFSLVVFLPLVMVSAFPFNSVINESIPVIGNYSWSAVIQLNK